MPRCSSDMRALNRVLIPIFTGLLILGSARASEEKNVVQLAQTDIAVALATVKTQPQMNTTWLLLSQRLVEQWLDESVLARRLVGTEYWKGLDPDVQQALEVETQRTMQRYVLEALQSWDGHSIELKNSQFNTKRGYVDIEIGGILNALTIPVRVELLRREQQWQLVDLSVQGIGYARMKSGQYQSLLREDPSGASFLALIRQKNDEFFNNINAFAQK